MATTYVSLANLQKYDGLLKTYIADGWYDKSAIDDFLAIIEAREANYVTRSVNDLVNYYTKSETYTKTEVQNLISLIPTFAIVVVDELPTEDISPTTVYLVRNENSNGNIYTEYIYVNNQWEELGSQNINLDDYYTKEEVDDLIPTSVSQLDNDSEFVSETNLSTLAVTGIKGESELVYQKGDLTLNKRMVGLSLVENKSPTQILGQMTSSNVTSALGYSPLNSAEYVQNSSTTDGYVPKSNGAVNKVWGTDSSGLVGWQDASSGGDVSNKMNKDGSNASNEVAFSGSFTVGSRASGSTVGARSLSSGIGNVASGINSHAEGNYTSAEGNYSHTEGNHTIAQGESSHAEGNFTIAGQDYQHVQGKYNDNKTTTLFEIGNGTSTSVRNNAFEIYSDGSMSQDNGNTKFRFTEVNGQKGYYDESGIFNVFGSGGGSGDMQVSTYDPDGDVATAGGIPDYVADQIPDVSGKADKVSNATNGNFAGLDANGNLTDSGHKHSDYMGNDGSNAAVHVQFAGASLTVGSRNPLFSVGSGSVSEGNNTTASGQYSHAEGKSSASGDYSHAENFSGASGDYSHSEGFNTVAGYDYQHVQGKYNQNKSDTLFEIGNGEESRPDPLGPIMVTTRNAFEVYQDGAISQDDGASKFRFTQNNGVDGYYDASGVFHAFGGSGGASSLNDLSDVSLSSLASGNVLKYDSTNSAWINGTETVTGVKGSSESTYRTGNISITKTNIGLGNVDNKSSATIRSELTSSNITSALGFTPANSSNVLTKASNGTVGQFAVSNGQGGVTWVTLTNAAEVQY